MISYTMVGTRDLHKVLAFYRPLFSEMSLQVYWEDAASVSFGKIEDMSFPRLLIWPPSPLQR